MNGFSEVSSILEAGKLWTSFPALVLNTIVYALVHIPKGLKETIASVPLGILLCIIVENTDVFYAAVIIHFTQAASSSFFSLRAQPDMKLVKK